MTHRSVCLVLVVFCVALTGLGVAPARALPDPESFCSFACTPGAEPCESCKAGMQWMTCGQFWGRPANDLDGDGVTIPSDNCACVANADQANCDGDGSGNVCDAFNGNLQPSGPVTTCMTDKDRHTAIYITFEHHVEQRYVDVSSCGAPDQWDRWIREDNDCVGISDGDCCWGLRYSIEAVGDSPGIWCGPKRDINYCH